MEITLLKWPLRLKVALLLEVCLNVLLIARSYFTSLEAYISSSSINPSIHHLKYKYCLAAGKKTTTKLFTSTIFCGHNPNPLHQYCHFH